MPDPDTQAVQALIDRYRETIGQVAYGIARKDPNVSMDGDEVAGFDGGMDDLDALIGSYEDVIGEVAVTIARQVLEETGAELPERVRQ